MKCQLCHREEETTGHHLIPVTRHKNKKNKRDFDRKEVKQKIPLCRPCHSTVHATLSEKELEREFNTLQSLLGHPEIQKFIQWIKNKPVGTKIKVRPRKR